MIWLGAFTSLIVSFYSHEETRSKPVAIVASFIMLLYILSSVVNEGFEFYTVKLSYLGSLTNVTQVLQNFLSLIAISPVVTGMEEPHAVQKYATAVSFESYAYCNQMCLPTLNLMMFAFSDRNPFGLHSKHERYWETT